MCGFMAWIMEKDPIMDNRIEFKTAAQRLTELTKAYEFIGLDYAKEHPELVARLRSDEYGSIASFNILSSRPPITNNLGGMFGNVVLLDVASMHPSSIEAMNFFGPYTKRFSDIKQARIDVKHGNMDDLKKRMNGALLPFVKPGESNKGIAGALKIVINSVYGLSSAHFPNAFNDVDGGINDRNVDNKVAKRGALFMILLKHKIQELGYTVVHIKTDSVKIADADEFIVTFVQDFGIHYGYSFELEAIYDRFCIVNKSTYVAHSVYAEDEGHWTSTGDQFIQSYVFKTLFSHEKIEFKDLCEAKSATTAIYLDFNEDLPEGEHNYNFVGKVSAFSPVKPGCGGGLLMRQGKEEGKFSAVTGSKGWRWKESSILRDNHQEDQIDTSYYQTLADKAIEIIQKYGDYDAFIDLSSPYISQNEESNLYLKKLIGDEHHGQ